ncbi:MAG: hypothetical protein ACMUIU_19745 [bacterium]
MLRERKSHRWRIMSFVILVAILIMLCTTLIQAQFTWTNLPPYNLLWPLWSPTLSPLDPVTKLPTPLVSTLSRNTVLPLQPALVWDNVAFPKGPVWLMYNTPAELGGGLLYWTSLYGLNPFPPSYLLTPGGFPIPNALLAGFSYLLPTKTKHFVSWVQVANLLYSSTYGVPFTSLLGAADIWGIPVL